MVEEWTVMNLQDGTNEKPGILPRALKELFNQASLNNSHSLTFSMSMLEVYMGNLRDLLAPTSSSRAYGALTRWYIFNLICHIDSSCKTN